MTDRHFGPEGRVHWDHFSSLWVASVTDGKEAIPLGRFKTEDLAWLEVNEALADLRRDK